jgi:hypothetical protein
VKNRGACRANRGKSSAAFFIRVQLQLLNVYPQKISPPDGGLMENFLTS